jgi:hypothetical protein
MSIVEELHNTVTQTGKILLGGLVVAEGGFGGAVLIDLLVEPENPFRLPSKVISGSITDAAAIIRSKS